MKKFISCDWGTTSFRLRLVDRKDLSVVAQISNDQGIAAFHQHWKNSGRPQQERLQYYLNHLNEQVSNLMISSRETEAVPIIISGMASSSIGMMELEYAGFPVALDGSKLKIAWPQPNVMIVSGARVEDDVLRGEETMLIGCQLQSSSLQLLIFPGTHSKHIEVRNGTATTFRTYMTGEFFHLLSQKSILANSIAAPQNGNAENPMFDEGVRHGITGNLLHEAFMVRTYHLLKNVPPDDNYFFLSGLLIGAELRDLAVDHIQKIILVASEAIANPYIRALKIVAPQMETELRNADKMLLNGQRILYERYA